MKKLKAILSSSSSSSNSNGSKEGDRAARGTALQHHEFADKSGSSGASIPWAQTPNIAPPSLPGPSPAQPPRPLINNAVLGSLPSAMMRAAPGPSTTGLNPARPGNATSSTQQPQQRNFPGVNGSQAIPFHENRRINAEIAALVIGDASNPNAVSRNAAGYIVSPEESALIRSLCSVICRWCDRCKSGIPYYKDSFICLECKFWLCRGCRYVHTTLHPQRIRVEMRQWINFSNEYEPVSNCSKCSTVQRARLQCSSKNCSHSLCVACFHVGVYLDNFLKDHLEKEPMHQEFFAIYPEEWSVTETWRTSTCVCYKEITVGRRPAWSTHCEKCHAPIEIGSSIYWCRDCRQAWGFGQWICEPCFRETNEDNVQHKQRHYFIKALINEDPNLPDSHKERFYCPICQQWLGETDYASHKHATGKYSDAMSVQRNPDLYFMLSPRQKDWQRLNMYRSCDKELVAKNSTQYPDEIASGTAISKCVMCQFLLAYNKPATICIKGNCRHNIYCASCTDSRRIDHRHKDSTYVVKLQRKVNLPVARVQCAKCRKSWFKTHFIGIFCGHCKYFAICWTCIGAASKSASFELAGGLPHQITPNSSSNKCPASDWILIYEPVPKVIRA